MSTFQRQRKKSPTAKRLRVIQIADLAKPVASGDVASLPPPPSLPLSPVEPDDLRARLMLLLLLLLSRLLLSHDDDDRRVSSPELLLLIRIRNSQDLLHLPLLAKLNQISS